jgi:hypothetical protein
VIKGQGSDKGGDVSRKDAKHAGETVARGYGVRQGGDVSRKDAKRAVVRGQMRRRRGERGKLAGDKIACPTTQHKEVRKAKERRFLRNEMAVGVRELT